VSPIAIFPAGTVSELQLFSLWRHFHYDVIRVARVYGVRNSQSVPVANRHIPAATKPAILLWRHSHYDVIGATPGVADIRTEIYRV